MNHQYDFRDDDTSKLISTRDTRGNKYKRFYCVTCKKNLYMAQYPLDTTETKVIKAIKTAHSRGKTDWVPYFGK